MEVVVHYPKSESGMKTLSRNIAEIHAKTVIEYINKMRFSELIYSVGKQQFKVL